MIALSVITLASGLSLAPAPAAPAAAPSYSMLAEQRLDRLTTAAEARLRARAIERALTEGLVRFGAELSGRMEATAQQRVASFSVLSKKP